MEMKTPQSKEELLQWVHDGRAELVNLVNQIPENRMLDQGVESDWSMKDVLAHIAAWETKLSQVFADVQASDVQPDWPTTDAAVDALNAQFHADNQTKSLAVVMSEFETSHAQALAATEAMPAADLFEADRFLWREGRPLWWMVAGNTYGHYGDHIPAIQTWLKTS